MYTKDDVNWWEWAEDLPGGGRVEVGEVGGTWYLRTVGVGPNADGSGEVEDQCGAEGYTSEDGARYEAEQLLCSYRRWSRQKTAALRVEGT